MKKTTSYIIALFLMTIALSACKQRTKQKNHTKTITDNPIEGKWFRNGHQGATSLSFKNDGLVEVDFGNDSYVDVVTQYKLNNDTITFIDKEGKMCPGSGVYKIYQTDYYVAFDLIADDCGGRIKTTMGFWTKPEYEKLLAILNKEIKDSGALKSYLNRARLYMALGKSPLAKKDFDKYIASDSLNARVYVNRAGTQFPNDMEGALYDCNKAISLDPDNKNAYFLRGLANYELGNEKEGCEDFSKAIELGFSVLKSAEYEKCSKYWEEFHK